MANSNGIITAPVRMPVDLSSVLGVSGTSLASSCQSSAINKWAKYKPFRYASMKITPVVGSNGMPTKQTATGSHYRCLIEANCGLTVNFTGQGYYNCIQKEISIMNAGNDDDIWTYNPPTGGSSQPFRLVDFCGYNHHATPFLWQSNMKSKRIDFKGSESSHMDINFTIEIYDRNNESVEGMIEADDLAGTIYNSDTLYYCVAICEPSISTSQASSSDVIAYAFADYPISNVSGRAVSFQLVKSSSYYTYIPQGSSSKQKQGTTTTVNLQVYHMLVRFDGDGDPEFIPVPYSEDYLPRTYMYIKAAATSVQFSMDSLANFVSSGSYISGLTFKSVDNDIAIDAWGGLTVKATLTNSRSSAATVNFGRVYCQTNCHSDVVACTAIYDSSYRTLEKSSITVPARGSLSVYFTFADVFDFDMNNYISVNGYDVEISLWGEDSSGNMTINVWSAGSDGTIIYNT